jgi:hypothetical protein
MEPRNEELPKNRFEIETLEERIAPDGNIGQLGYEGQPGNQGNGLQGYEGQPGNQGGH